MSGVVNTKDGKGGSETFVDAVRTKSDSGSVNQRAGNGRSDISRAADGILIGSTTSQHTNNRHVDHGDGSKNTVHSNGLMNADGSHRSNYRAAGKDGHSHHDRVVENRDSTVTGPDGQRVDRHGSNFKRNVVEDDGGSIHTMTGDVDSKGAGKRTDGTASHGNVHVDSFSRTNQIAHGNVDVDPFSKTNTRYKD